MNAKNMILSYFDGILNDDRISKNFKSKVNTFKTNVKSLNKTGDIYDYIKRFSLEKHKKKYKELNNCLMKNNILKLSELEEEMENKYPNELKDKTKYSNIKINEVYTAMEIGSLAKNYNPTAGIYTSEDNIVIKANLNNGRYDNKWIIEDEKLKYYMQARKGKYDINNKLNKDIINSESKNIHLFIKIEKNAYKYKGIYKYEKYITLKNDKKYFILNKKDRTKLSLEEYINLETENKTITPTHDVILNLFKRDAEIVKRTLKRANGFCELCKKKAPFIRKSDKTPYLEVHHIIPLSDGGEDTMDNTIALCPNCHRKEHFGCN